MIEVVRVHAADADAVEPLWREFVPTARLNGVDRQRFGFEWSSVAAPGFASIAYEIAAGVRSSVSPDHQLFACQVTAPGLRIGTDRAAFDPAMPWLGSREATTAEWATTASVRAFAFDLDEAQRWARAVVGDPRFSLGVEGTAPVSPGAASAWSAAFEHVHGSLLQLGPDEAVLAAELQRHALLMTLGAFRTTFTEAMSATPPGRAAEAVVRRARAFIDANAQEPITVDSVAAAVHMSTRGLQYAFRRATGESPTAYLRRARLAGAHADLLAGRGAGVAAIARRWGFHPSRFAVRYRDVYGRPPGEVWRARER